MQQTAQLREPGTHRQTDSELNAPVETQSGKKAVSTGCGLDAGWAEGLLRYSQALKLRFSHIRWTTMHGQYSHKFLPNCSFPPFVSPATAQHMAGHGSLLQHSLFHQGRTRSRAAAQFVPSGPWPWVHALNSFVCHLAECVTDIQYAVCPSLLDKYTFFYCRCRPCALILVLLVSKHAAACVTAVSCAMSISDGGLCIRLCPG